MVDLHGLHEKEALKFLEEQIDSVQRYKPRNHKSMPESLYVLIGKGQKVKVVPFPHPPSPNNPQPHIICFRTDKPKLSLSSCWQG